MGKKQIKNAPELKANNEVSPVERFGFRASKEEYYELGITDNGLILHSVINGKTTHYTVTEVE